MILKKNQVIKFYRVSNLVCEFDEVTLVVPIHRFNEVLFFLIILNYVIIYFSFYHIVKKITLKKNMLLNFRKFMGL